MTIVSITDVHAATPKVEGFPWSAKWPSWLVWTAEDGRNWQVTLGDHDTAIIPAAAPDEDQAITVSAGPHAGARWFVVTDPRGLAAALIAAADTIEAGCWRCATEGLGARCERHRSGS